MRWLWFVGSMLCFVVLFKTTSIALALICLVAALVFMVIGTLAVAAERINGTRGNEIDVLAAEKLRLMRNAQAQRQAEAEAQIDSAPVAPLVRLATASALISAESASSPIASEETQDTSPSDEGQSAPNLDTDINTIDRGTI